MGIVRDVAKAGSTVIVVLHDLQVPARWADGLMVMKNGELYAAGSAAGTMTSVMIREIHGMDATVERTPSGSCIRLVRTDEFIQLDGGQLR